MVHARITNEPFIKLDKELSWYMDMFAKIVDNKKPFMATGVLRGKKVRRPWKVLNILFLNVLAFNILMKIRPIFMN